MGNKIGEIGGGRIVIKKQGGEPRQAEQGNEQKKQKGEIKSKE